MQKPAKFAILSMARSGTNYFVEKLEYHPLVMCHYEPFHPEKVMLSGKRSNYPDDVLETLQSVDFRQNQPQKFMEYLMGQDDALNMKFRAYGFKIFTGHNRERYWEFAQDPSYHILVVQRQNFLKLYSSYLLASQNDVWAVYDKSKQNQTRQAAFNGEDYDMRKAEYDNLFAAVLRTVKREKVPYMHLFYEDFIQSDEYFQEIFEFLGVGRHKLPDTRIVKQNQEDVLARFINPEAVKAHLPAEDLERYLEL